MRIARRRLLALVLLASLAPAAAGQARELRIASGVPPAHPATSHLYAAFQKFVAEESGGKLTATLFGPEVVGLRQMKDALQTGLIDIGNFLPLYFPAELPNFALAGELSLSARDPHAVAAALTAYTVACASCLAEQVAFGMVYLGSGSSDPYALLTRAPVRRAEDLRGLRLRSGGAPYSRWAEHFGAVPVALSVLETFEAMSQGTIDGSMASVGDLLSFRLVELVKGVTRVPLGTYFATSNFAIAKATWDSLTVEERMAVARAANRANASFTQRWGYDFPKLAIEAANKAGIEFVEPDPALVEAAQAFAIEDRANAARIARERFGIADAEGRVAAFITELERWEQISAELDHDEGAMAQRIWEEVWSKVDFATYGQ